MNSIWLSEDFEYAGKPLGGDIKTDVLVIGGGMAGILCAYKLKNAGIYRGSPQRSRAAICRQRLQ